MGVLLQSWYLFNANLFSRKYGWHWISLYQIVCDLLFLQWIMTDRNPTKGPRLIIVSIMPWHLPRYYWPFRWNTKIYSLFIDWIFDHSTSKISICNRRQAMYPPGSDSSSIGDSWKLWPDLIINHFWWKGWIWNMAKGILFTPKVGGHYMETMTRFSGGMISKQH